MKSKNQRRDRKKEQFSDLERLERKILRKQKKWKQRRERKASIDFWKNFYFNENAI